MSDDDWMSLTVHAPREVINAMLALLEREHDFQDISPIDWCTMERPQDYAHVSYAPAPVGHNQYSIDWRRGEHLGDVVVEIDRGGERD